MAKYYNIDTEVPMSLRDYFVVFLAGRFYGKYKLLYKYHHLTISFDSEKDAIFFIEEDMISVFTNSLPRYEAPAFSVNDDDIPF